MKQSVDIRITREVRKSVLAAVKRRGIALKFAEAFTNDQEIVLAAVTQDGNAIGCASKALQNDRVFVLSVDIIKPWRRSRWVRLAKQVIKFDRDDKAFLALFHPDLIVLQAEEICTGGDEAGPQSSPFGQPLRTRIER